MLRDLKRLIPIFAVLVSGLWIASLSSTVNRQAGELRANADWAAFVTAAAMSATGHHVEHENVPGVIVGLGHERRAAIGRVGAPQGADQGSEATCAPGTAGEACTGLKSARTASR
jgi:hypothetical protein